MKTYINTKFGRFDEDDVSVSVRACGADCGGGGEVLVVETLVFDEGQITCPKNGLHPKWGGAATLSVETPDER